MSYKAVRWALYDAPMLFTEKGKPDVAARAVLIARAERADENGRKTYAGPADLMKSIGYDERTIQRADRRLEEAGLLVRCGLSHVGTVMWRLDMTQKVTDAERAAADPRIERRREADKARQARYRKTIRAEKESAESIEGDGVSEIPVTDSESVTSRRSNPDVTDSVSGCHGRSAPRTVSRTTNEPPGGTTLGGTLPPNPLRPPSASPRGTYDQNSLTQPITQQLALQRNPLPHASADELAPDHLAPVVNLHTREVS